MPGTASVQPNPAHVQPEKAAFENFRTPSVDESPLPDIVRDSVK
jgi:hypothetical protein